MVQAAVVEVAFVLRRQRTLSLVARRLAALELCAGILALGVSLPTMEVLIMVLSERLWISTRATALCVVCASLATYALTLIPSALRLPKELWNGELSSAHGERP